MAPVRQFCRRVPLCLLILLQILQARRRRLREERLRRARARLERFRRFLQRQRSQRATFVATLAALLAELNPPFERRLWMVKRNSDWWDTNGDWTEGEWLDNMRMSRNTFQFICEELEEYLHKETTNMRAPIPVSKRVGLTLWKMATNADYRSMASLFGIAKSTMCKILREVCDAIVQKLGHQFVHPPAGAELDGAVGRFEAETGVPQCAGAIDATHIPVAAPGTRTTEYCNGSGWHSVVLQVLVDNSFCILDFQIGYKGSTHDADLFTASSLYSKGESGKLFPSKPRPIADVDVPLFVVADAPYPLRDWVMKAYPSDGLELTADQQLFNCKLDAIHQVARTAVARLRARWRCLATRNTTVDFLPLLIQACCVMHNVCESLQQTFSDEWLVEKDFLEMPACDPLPDGDKASAEEIRRALVAHLAEKERSS